MFVSKSKYQKALAEIEILTSMVIAERKQFKSLLEDWNELIVKVNRKGGQDFLDNAVFPSKIKKVEQFTQDEIRTLINLCHPDKHGQKESACEITKKLLSLRK